MSSTFVHFRPSCSVLIALIIFVIETEAKVQDLSDIQSNSDRQKRNANDHSKFCEDQTANVTRKACYSFFMCCDRQCGPNEFYAECTTTGGRAKGKCICTDLPKPTPAPTESPRDTSIEADSGRGSHAASRGSSGDQVCGRPEIKPKITVPERPQAVSRIVGGTVAEPHSWPWQVALGQWLPVHHSWAHHCGGSLLNTRHVLIAAHCLNNITNHSQAGIFVGLHNLSVLAQRPANAPFEIKKVFLHPNYIPGLHSNDIAVIRLKRSVTFSPTVRPICLAETEAPADKYCIATGWGKKQTDGIPSTLLMQVRLPIVSKRKCNNFHFFNGAVDNTMICAGEKGKDSCGGDSGGPLVCERADGIWELHGVVSWGMENCGMTDWPGVYSNVVYFKDWIKKYSV